MSVGVISAERGAWRDQGKEKRDGRGEEEEKPRARANDDERRKRKPISNTSPSTPSPPRDSPKVLPSLLGVIGGLNASSCATLSGTAARFVNASAVSAIFCVCEKCSIGKSVLRGVAKALVDGGSVGCG